MEPHPITRRLAARLGDGGGQPAAQLIVEDIWLSVVDGSLETGERLPTARQLAIALGVSPRTVDYAYAELERRGVLANRVGEGTFVSLDPPPEEERERHRELAELCRETVERARSLGFGPDDLIDLVAEYRNME